MTEEKKMRVFIRDDSGEAAAYCGLVDTEENRQETAEAIANFIEGLLSPSSSDGETEDIQLEYRSMTDREIKDLPLL